MSNRDLELRPRNGHTLVVGIVCRISGCAKQKEISNEDQTDNAQELIREGYDGPVEFRAVATTKAKGEALDRPELEAVEAAYRSKEFDAFVFDDLSRLIRGGEAVRLLGVGVDNGTRTICIQDGIDTNDGTWEEDALNACSENVAHNERTSKRIKQKSMNRFKKNGGVPARPIFGYIVPPGSKSYDDWQRDDSWTPLIKEGERHLREMRNYSATADWFNQQGVPDGPYTRRKGWDGYRIQQFYSNPLLKGYPARGNKHTIKIHGVGRRVAVKNPKGPIYYHAPHLAHLDPIDFDSLNELLQKTNTHHARPLIDGVDPHYRVPKKRTRFPGQYARCAYCGRHFVWGANGITENLMCTGAREWHCWNAIGFPGALAAERLVVAIVGELDKLTGFPEQFAAMVASAGDGAATSYADEESKLRHDERALERETENVKASIRSFGPTSLLATIMDELATRQKELLVRRQRIEHRQRQRLELPESPEVLRELLELKFRELAIDSPEFGGLMHRLVPEFNVYLVRRFDGGHLLPRAKVRLNLAGTFPDVNFVPGLAALVTQDLTIDLFDQPSQVIRIRGEAARLLEESERTGKTLTHREIAKLLPEQPTSTAVTNALALHRQMLAGSLENPYVSIVEPPEDYPKLRRHRNPRYHFEPLPGHQRPEL